MHLEANGAKHFLHGRRFANDLWGAGQRWRHRQALLFLSMLVIIMTAHSDLDSAVASYQGGAFEYRQEIGRAHV